MDRRVTGVDLAKPNTPDILSVVNMEAVDSQPTAEK